MYAVARLRGRRDRYVRVAMAVPLVVAAIAAPAQVVVGDWAAREVAEHQPTKLAAFEGLGKTEQGAPLHIGGWYDERRGEVRYGIEVPKLLSLLAFHDPNATVQGLDEVPGDDRPPVNVVRVAFATMVGIGTLMALFGAALLVSGGAGARCRRRRWFLRAVVALGPLSVVALIAGWVTTEVGRQPWVVYGHMRTEEAVTGAGGIPVGYAALVVVYAALVAAAVWLLRRLGAGAARGRGGRWGSLSSRCCSRSSGLAAYVVLGGADFGAGLWYMLLPGERRRPLRDHTYHAMGPVWEANHVWLIFVLVVVWTAYPVAFGSIFSTLYVPLFAAALGIILRGTCYAVRGVVSGPREEPCSARCSASPRC